MSPIPKRSLLAVLLLAASGNVRADEAPELGRYLSLYPGLYFNGGYAQDERDASFDRNGTERDSAAPQTPGQTSFPEKSAHAAFTWHFPMFESYGIPLVSDRLHTARMTLRYVDTASEGALATFTSDAGDDARTEADDLDNSRSGVGDVLLEFGTFLAGSADWRTRAHTPYSVLLLAGVNLPTGLYGRDAPVSAGSNTWFFQGRLGAHWQPWRGAVLDAGLGYRSYTNNEEPAFGSLSPHKQGDDTIFDLSFAHRVIQDLYAGAFYTYREGEPNEYRNPAYAPNAPPHPDASTDTYPRKGVYTDGGTDLRTAGASVYYFVTQRLLAALHYARPLAGASGQFMLPFDEKNPSGCIPGSTNCTVTPGQTVLVDGMGPARSYASDRVTLTLTYNFGLGDAFTCTGCKQ